MIFKVSVYDERYLTGELVYFKKGIKMTEEGKNNISKGKKGKYLGEKSSQFGKCWIHNLDLKENKSIKKEEINAWLEKGWIKGRKINI